MGRLVKLWKLEENDELVIYLYGSSRDACGKLIINKTTGEVEGEHVLGMSPNESWFFFGMLAKAKAETLFRKGQYPDDTIVGM
ncbi:MAG: hypothetical protein ACFCU9_06615 [Cyanophyceae cyanobacterium]